MFGGKHKKRWHDIIAFWHLNGCSPRLPIDFPSPYNLVKWEKCLSITQIARNKNKTWAVKCMSNQPLSLTFFFSTPSLQFQPIPCGTASPKCLPRRRKLAPTKLNMMSTVATVDLAASHAITPTSVCHSAKTATELWTAAIVGMSVIVVSAPHSWTTCWLNVIY